MKMFLSLVVSFGLISPAFACVNSGGYYDDHKGLVGNCDVPEVDVVEFDQVVEMADMPMADDTKDITIHWTSSFSQDWCMWIVVSTPDFTVLDGGINGTICDGSADDNWRIDSVEPLGGGTYEVHATHVGPGSCASTLCMIGTKDGRNVDGTEYGWNGACDSWPMENGLINGCNF